MAAVTSENLARVVAKLVAVDAIPMVFDSMDLGYLVTRDFTPEGGWVSSPVTVDYFDGQQVREIEVTLDTLAEASFVIPDVTKAIASPDLMKMYMSPAVATIAQSIDARLVASIGEFRRIELTGTGGWRQAIGQIIDVLHSAIHPLGRSYRMVVPLRELVHIRHMDEWKSGGESSIHGYMMPSRADGEIGGLSVFRTHGGLLPQLAGLAFADPALALVTRRPPAPTPGCGAIAEPAELGNFGMQVVLSYNPHTLTQRFTLRVLCGAVALRPECGVQIAEASHV